MAKTAAAKRPTQELLPPEAPVSTLPVPTEDELSATQAGAAITSFLSGLARFFRTALDLENKAKETLAHAKILTPPTSADEDAALQRFVQRTSAEKREVENHWSITVTVSSFHKRLTGRRAIATAALEQANTLANTLHNRYVETERRKAAEAQEKLRLEAEAKARAEREAELARAEAEAVRREEASADLSERERAFVDFVTGPYPDPARAAQHAGYKNPAMAGLRLVALPKIHAAIEAKAAAKAIRDQAAATAAAPLRYDVPEVQADVVKASGAHDRTTWSAEVIDEAAFVQAVISGKYGIPADCLQINQTQLNIYARSLQLRLDLWVGVRAVKTTKVI